MSFPFPSIFNKGWCRCCWTIDWRLLLLVLKTVSSRVLSPVSCPTFLSLLSLLAFCFSTYFKVSLGFYYFGLDSPWSRCCITTEFCMLNPEPHYDISIRLGSGGRCPERLACSMLLCGYDRRSINQIFYEHHSHAIWLQTSPAQLRRSVQQVIHSVHFRNQSLVNGKIPHMQNCEMPGANTAASRLFAPD